MVENGKTFQVLGKRYGRTRVLQCIALLAKSFLVVKKKGLTMCRTQVYRKKRSQDCCGELESDRVNGSSPFEFHYSPVIFISFHVILVLLILA